MSAYHLGYFWNSCLEPTNIAVIWNHPDFQSLDNQVVKHRDKIIHECLKISNSKDSWDMAEFDPQHAALVKDHSWKTIWLRYFGAEIPIVMSNELKSIVNHPIVYNASLSILEPGGEIPLHVGQCQALIKYHIPIVIPEGDVGIVYNGKKYQWTDRMLFNDTLPHAVWNHTEEPRIILLMDIIRPMPFPWNIINHRITEIAWFDPVVRKRYQKIVGLIG